MTVSQGGAIADEQLQAERPEIDLAEPDEGTAEQWAERVRAALSADSGKALEIAEKALGARPGDGELLLLGALAALAAALPGRALVHLKRFHKRYGSDRAALLLTGIALAQEEKVAQAFALLRRHGLAKPWQAVGWFVGDPDMHPWLRETLARIERTYNRQQRAAAKPRPAAPRPAATRGSSVPPVPLATAPAPLPTLRRADVAFQRSSSSATRRRCGSTARSANPLGIVCAPSSGSLVCFKASTSCSACPALPAWRRMLTKSRPFARC
jgi:hypothetical protein